ncbi:hypothetical protein BVRB_004480 [Beta vulgaris subsp. vulgaris]|uniref:Uncharacterized protein n=1 Tax=Beta vulgaris subsp. vulgaris TaxID=3555 RepID=A0A0J8B7S6_BETVV|nr:uncharacterized protein LOC104883913 [Beta vulgaris subsp. vulgaris]KMS95847.1 hypothetical protein BVRB_004480 [Beta vulgaris subsp. vulgaris]
MDADEIGSSRRKHSPESKFSFEGEIEDGKTKKAKLGFEEDRVMALLYGISEMGYLYRNSGERVEVDLNTVKGKYLLFVCFYLPPYFRGDFEFDSVYSQDLIPTCFDLYSHRDDFEIVLVTKLADDNPDSEPAFNDPMRVFPMSCLSVPFERRNFICDFFEPRLPVAAGDGIRFKCIFVNVAENILLFAHLNDSMTSLVGHLKDLLRKSSFDVQRSYQRLAKNMWPVKSFLSLTAYYCPIARIFQNVKPEYSDDINTMVSQLFPIQIGQSFDAKFLLSGGLNELGYLVRIGGERVELGKAIRDKYIMVCCFHVPMFHGGWNSSMVQSLINTCSELYAADMDFEMVVVAKMKKLADHKQVFDHFLSGFPSSCFVIPFEDSKRRNFICKYLELDDIQCLLLDKKENILLHGYPRFARSYGADAFPFTDEKLQKLKADEKRNRETFNNYIVQLLTSNPSVILRKTNAADGSDTMTISDLNKKDVVGLFKCVNGKLIPKLQEVYEQCKIQQKPFEVLLVYIPFSNSLDPKNHKLYIDNLLQKHKLSLWYMPFNNSVHHKLCRFTNSCFDQLIIFRAQDAHIDIYGAEVMITFGIDAYPFSREELVQRELNKFKEVTLETLLVSKSRDYLLKGGANIPVAHLRGKNILVWISSLSVNCIPFYHKLFLWYKENQAKNPDFEVVFVRKHSSDPMDDDLTLSDVMPWLVCPFDADHSSSVQEKLFPNMRLNDDDLVQFGTDGLLCSLKAGYLLHIGVDECGKIPFGGSNLHREFLCKICDSIRMSDSLTILE